MKIVRREEPADAGRTVPWGPEDIERLGTEDVPPDPKDPLVGTVLRKKWRVLERLGAGSFGTVYKVRDERGGWIEALKILAVERLAGAEAENTRVRFLREAQIMKRLGAESPHIVGLSTYEEDVEAGLIYFLMEHVDGQVLSQVIHEQGPLSPARVIHIALQVCDALIVAHEGPEPVIHRDLKLENLMLTRDRFGRELVKIFDFGIAKIKEQDPDSRLTMSGALGTPGYAAPEQLRAEAVDGRTDLFALGVVLYALLTGRDPWLGLVASEPTSQTYELMLASDQGAVRPMEGGNIPAPLVDIVKRLLRRDPAQRFQSARDLRAALEAAAEIVGIDDGSAPGAPRGTAVGTLGGQSTDSARRGFRGGRSVGSDRRLAAVWFADLVGYSSLSSTDEEAALELLESFHTTARQIIAAGGGRLVQFIGDAAFAEFGSTERAVRTAMHFRTAFAEVTRDSPSKPQLRVGVHVGDVLMGSDGDLFGDGVNVAARIQNEADPGQIVVSQDVWRQLKQRRDFGFISIGERKLKGMVVPVWLFAVTEEVSTGTPTPVRLGTPARPPGRLRRILPIAAAFVAASAVILLSVDRLIERFELDGWVFPTAIGLLVVGLLVTLGTAWFQSRPTWERSVGEQPPWSLDVPDLIGAVSRRELPDLTWARALVGGVAAFALLFGAAGAFVVWQDRAPAAGSAVSGGGGPDPAVAIVPLAFGGEPEWFLQGFPTLLATLLDDVDGIRAVDPQAIMARVGEGQASREAMLQIGADVGAQFVLGGRAEREGERVAVSLELLDVSSGEIVAEARAEGDPLSPQAIVESAARALLGTGALPAGPSAAAALDVERTVTGAPDALRAFVEAERDLSAGDPEAATFAFERALEADPEFGVALAHLAFTRFWSTGGTAAQVGPEVARALARGARLTPRERLLAEGLAGVQSQLAGTTTKLEGFTRAYPDDPDGWFLLSVARGRTIDGDGAEGAAEALVRAIDVAPGYAPAYRWLVDASVSAGDTAAAREWVERLERSGPASPTSVSLAAVVDEARSPPVGGPGSEEARGARVATAPARQPTPTVREDPAVGQFERLLQQITARRASSDGDVHPALRSRLAALDADIGAARSAARERRPGQALTALRAASSRYDELLEESRTRARIDDERGRLGELRRVARDSAMVGEADALDLKAVQAAASGRYQEALDATAQAAELLRRAASAPQSVPGSEASGNVLEVAGPPEPARQAPSAIAAGVLAELERALEAEDLSRVRAVWSSISEAEAQGLERLFSSVRDLAVEYQVRSAAERGPRVVVSVRTIYTFYAEQARRTVSQETEQVFELGFVGDTWLVLGSRTQG